MLTCVTQEKVVSSTHCWITPSLQQRQVANAIFVNPAEANASPIMKSDGGSACTSVITEYRHRANRFREPYTIEAEYMNIAEIRGHLKELLWSFRQLYIEGIEDAASDAEYKMYQSQSELAWHTLEAAFGHRKELTREYLQDSSEGADNRIYDQLRIWACEIDWPGDGQGMWLSTAATADECIEKMLTFSEDSLWPFTKVIR
jgi:hypothetical protein